jgi:hypothetical protein
MLRLPVGAPPAGATWSWEWSLVIFRKMKSHSLVGEEVRTALRGSPAGPEIVALDVDDLAFDTNMAAIAVRVSPATYGSPLALDRR